MTDRKSVYGYRTTSTELFQNNLWAVADLSTEQLKREGNGTD